MFDKVNLKIDSGGPSGLLLVTAQDKFSWFLSTVAVHHGRGLVSIAEDLSKLVEGALIGSGSPFENAEGFKQEPAHSIGMYGLNLISSKDITPLMVEKGFNVYPLGHVVDVDEYLAQSFKVVNGYFLMYFQQRGDLDY